MQDIAIYCVCFPGHLPLKTQVYQKNIMGNSISISDAYRKKLNKKHYLFDDSSDNIAHMNWALGDLSSTYWIWKNSTHKVVGTSQYRRFWDESIRDITFADNTLYVQDPVSFGITLKEQYIQCHGDIGISILEELSQQGKIPFTKEMLDKTFSLNYLHSCNMFIAHKHIYDKFCEVLFGIVFQIYESYKDVFEELDSYNKRTPAFLAERIITALVVNKEHFFPDLKIETIKWSQLKPSLWQKLFR